MSLITVTIAGVVNPIEIYGGTAAAVDYLGSSLSDGASAWLALSTDDRSRALVAATRYIDRQAWQGAADAQGGTTLQWPRSGITNSDGTTLDPTTVPTALVQAVFELAGLIASDSSVQSQADSGTNISAVKAGTAGVNYFRPTSAADGTATVLPLVVSQLVGHWLAAAQGFTVGIANGTKSSSLFQDDPCDPCAPWNPNGLRWPF